MQNFPDRRLNRCRRGVKQDRRHRRQPTVLRRCPRVELEAAHRPSAWNNSGGAPLLIESASLAHIRPGDFNGNGTVGVDDLLSFLGAFISSRMDADADANGVLEIADVLIYIQEWFKQ